MPECYHLLPDMKSGQSPGCAQTTEQKCLNDSRETGIPWKKWGPYLSERQWSTVREDYSQDGTTYRVLILRFARRNSSSQLMLNAEIGRGSSDSAWTIA
jgi:hypothetical protein